MASAYEPLSAEHPLQDHNPSRIDMDLFPGHEQLAAELERRFGDAVNIRMGTTRYCGGPGQSGRCADAQGATSLPRGLHLALTLENRTVSRSDPAAAGSLKVRY